MRLAEKRGCSSRWFLKTTDSLELSEYEALYLLEQEPPQAKSQKEIDFKLKQIFGKH